MTDPSPASPLAWTDGTPRSTLYGDVYYSLQDGLAESRAVFLAGCGLPDAWNGRRHFTVAELGFGTGLNIAALLQLWSRTAHPTARLSIFSIEAHPMPREDAARALAAWPELEDFVQPMLGAWPTGRRGRMRIDLPFNATLDLAIAEAGDALEGWRGQADAWFLDGFSPASNPQMWRDELMGLVAERSRPGARLATFTVAGHVRRSLAAHGFTVDKRPGHGRKRERLEARYPGEASDPRQPRVAIVGGGIAGAGLARAFRRQGVEPVIFAARDAGASGNPAALVTPALDAGGGPRAKFYADAFARAADIYGRQEGTVIAVGALQLETNDRDAARFDAVAVQDIFDPEMVRRLTPRQTSDRLGEPPIGALDLRRGLVVDPAAIIAAWRGPVIETEVSDLDAIDADAIIIAAGFGSAAFIDSLTPVRGQASFVDGVACSQPSAFGAYAIPTRTGVLFGATHDRGRTDVAVEQADHGRNLGALAKRRPNLAAQLRGQPLQGRAALRATTADRMPLAGRLEETLYVLTALGSRGFTTAPLLAEHVAALVLDRPSPLGATEAALVDPLRPLRT